MKERIRRYIESVFDQAPKTKQAMELKEEILQNILDKYDDLIAEGVSEEVAYNNAIASIGNVDELFDTLQMQMDEFYQYPAYELDKRRQRSAAIIALAVMMYIVSFIPVILFDDSPIAICMMFLIIALATGMIIYDQKTKIRHPKLDMMQEYEAWQEKHDDTKKLRRAITSCMWLIITAFYFWISFTTGSWHITWITFLIGSAIEEMIKALFDLVRRRDL